MIDGVVAVEAQLWETHFPIRLGRDFGNSPTNWN